MSDTHIIVGAGQAGANAAFAMRQAGFAGSIALIGAEPVLPYERPSLSKEMLTAETMPEPSFVRPQADFEAHGIDLRLGRRAVGIDVPARRLTLDDGRSLPFDKLLLATGGDPRRLAIPGGEFIAYLRTAEDAAELRRKLRAASRVVCIGAGVIGLECAASAARLGIGVTVLEAGSRAMERCAPVEISDVIEGLHRASGVDLRFGEAVVAVERSGEGFCVHTARGDLFPADLVVAGIGIVRDLALAESAGVAVDGGIRTDEFGETSVPGIYAAGDVASLLHPRYGRHIRLENWQHAQNHAIATGRSMAGERTAYADLPSFWTDQFDLHLQVSGFAQEAQATILRGDVAARDFVAFHVDAAGRLIAASAANRPREFRFASRLVQAGALVDPDRARDASIPIQRLVAAG